MASFVLVHGSFVGGWVWRKLGPLLSSQGHSVYTPTLTGLGERSHLARCNVGLSTHIQDIDNLLRFEDLTNIILVGHSYGGLVISGVADRLPEKIAHLVFLDAVIPLRAESLEDQRRPRT